MHKFAQLGFRALTCLACLQLTGGISKGLAMLTLDQDYISRFRNQPMTLQQRLIYALQALGVGLYEGVIGQLTLSLMLSAALSQMEHVMHKCDCDGTLDCEDR